MDILKLFLFNNISIGGGKGTRRHIFSPDQAHFSKFLLLFNSQFNFNKNIHSTKNLNKLMVQNIYPNKFLFQDLNKASFKESTNYNRDQLPRSLNELNSRNYLDNLFDFVSRFRISHSNLDNS